MQQGELPKVSDRVKEKSKEGSEELEIKYLRHAAKVADDEVKHLEFWSDVKDIATKGETIGASDDRLGWGRNWQGIDGSGPADVLGDRDKGVDRDQETTRETLDKGKEKE